jgi:hypothetical protein
MQEKGIIEGEFLIGKSGDLRLKERRVDNIWFTAEYSWMRESYEYLMLNG